MIDKEKLKETVEGLISGTDIFLTDLSVSTDNRVVVEIDSAEGIDLSTCERITNGILAAFDRDVEDYELEVGSAGLTSPFKVDGQYTKNIGERVEVLTKDGRKLYGILKEYNKEDKSFILEYERKVKEAGMKRPEIRTESERLTVDGIKMIRLDFK